MRQRKFFRFTDRSSHLKAEPSACVRDRLAGDVVIVTAPGYHLDFNAGTGTNVGDFFQPSTFFGQHGYDPRLPG